ncbi:Galactose oxidase [Mycena indigotica]|uniref:Galactose oxidase n=1 Tax=Mycena indigotica TaxID=2126181 RepID=A0A8H6VYJ3_9AGAR|nr:Galactose oxidase [Mycena indigotica]KAF7294948.1 Galactose oxidase [Mycena indigotica]
MNWWLYFLDKTNFTVTTLTAAVILFTRSAGVAYFGSTVLATTLSVKYVLKRLIKQPRPPVGRKKTYGCAFRELLRRYKLLNRHVHRMPSTHSASVSFYATYITLSALQLPLHPSLPPAARLFPVVAIPWAILVMLSRIWLGHHTVAQIAAGCGYGIACAWLSLKLWTAGGLNAYGSAAEQLVHEWLR